MHLLSVFSLRNRALIALVTIVVAVFGGVALTSLKQELAPNVQFPQIAIVSSYPGATPEVVNDDVSTPIEQAVQIIPGLEGTTATSSTSTSTVSAEFTYGTDLDNAEQKIQSAINRLSLPDAVDTQVVTGSLDDLPIIQIAVTGYDDAGAQQLVDRLTNTTVPDLQKLDGVREASIYGDAGQRVTITPDRDALAAAGLTTAAFQDALDANGQLIPGGTITQDGQTLSIQAGERLTSADQVAALPLLGGTSAVTIDDVADVALTSAPVTSISRVNGEPALTVAVTKTLDANTVDVSETVRDAIPGLATDLGDGVDLTVVFDQAPFIQQSIDSLAEEGLLGLVFAVIVILVFLLSIRSTIVTAISIPTSVLITFIGLQASGYTLNILTLGALTIAIGRVVDDSIVVIENIKRHLTAGADRLQAITVGVREVAGAITASTVTTVVVFLPLAFVGNITGELFRPFALTVTIALIASLFVALTIVPVLAYWFLRAPKAHKHAGSVESGSDVAAEESLTTRASDPTSAAPLDRLRRAYVPVLRGTLRRPVVTIIVAVLVLGGTAAAVPFMKTNFLGASGQNTFSVTQTLAPATSLDAQSDAATRVETALEGVDGIETVQLTIGSSGTSISSFFGGSGDSTVTYSITTDESADQDALQADVRDRLADITDVGDIEVTASSGFGTSNDISIDVSAPDPDTLQTATDTVLSTVQDLPGTAEASSNLASAQPIIGVQIDRDEAATLGLSEVAVGAIVSQAVQPLQVGSIEIDDSSIDVYTVAPNPPANLDELKAVEIPGPTGPVRLDSIATIEQTTGPTSVTTSDAVRTATVTVTPSSDDLSSASTEVTDALAGLDLPAGADTEIGGVTADQANAFSQLGLAVLIAILIVYIVMVATFRSLLQPFLLLVSIPFAATGAILLQIASGIPLGVASLIGVLMLVGIVVTNAIVLIDLVNQYRTRGLPVREALLEGASRRLRPILMTATATIFALLPMALGITGHGGFISQPLAIVVIGGLVSSTVLTLVVLPVLYYLVEGARERRAARKAERA
ncbi:efflux RND transporter permease subunit [Frigoribacterium faeni]|uniref:HAE1 family hydrophobic/amphiphilic exporter-1 n=1 Tax=Frigoribacterium faeni TaxID=145483 RepID=A0A7W3JJU6_9MICO|nr:efflux RND transporter permease subunit [Frigoribacterium faeni]MBA8814194.1 HAE1 family hydrophobic/amphiphilic exporter-1 [Frigoribacterium faeni]GEK84498.1 multidrug transporter [Frigoribacterium faeni]